ncbi:MAG: ATP-binding protein [Thermoanaerobaculia bacterium]
MIQTNGTNENCPICDGRGWTIKRDEGVGTAVPCGCRRSEEEALRTGLAAVPERYLSCTLDGFHVSNPDPATADQLFSAKKQSQDYADSFVGENGRFRDTGLLFIGAPGVGKTHLAVALLNELIRRYRVRGLFVDFTELIHDIQSTFSPRSAESKFDLLHPVMNAEVLVLDELGAQKPSEWVNDILHLILNKRYTNRLPSIFTTNYRLDGPFRKGESLDRGPDFDSPELLSQRVRPSLLSRMYEMARPIVIEAGDYRRDIRCAQNRL